MKRIRPLWLALAFFGSAAMAGDERPGAASPGHPVALIADPFLETETVRLWPGRAAGATDDSAGQTPTVTIVRPQRGQANGAAVIVAPGGGYVELAGNIEGRQVADWFASRGITAFVLKYRIGPTARLPIPLLDGARAIRFARANATRLGLDPTRIGMIGFSAGGHLAATTAATASPGQPTSSDPVERASSRPDFLVLGYPWLEGTAIDAKGRSPYCTFAGGACDPRAYEQYRPTRSVTAAMPPVFIFHTSNDPIVDARGITRFYDALQSRRVPVELHIFALGRHGSGLGGSDPALARWPELMEPWLRALGMFDRTP
ncbi:alpha/beta hydrolase [Sphingomonas sp. Leaf17]|uniref:alpha/beta hydrolase n=1 Tax=Sphingomonas sp. Leaf17 TaxID=1735683 RepID=UPI0006F1FA81|nr:alpha/beta hydrolase [Sphingomonas sp. Leaf17]KQM67687.1 alpha/beta hydrolase [Sphingomonas sp. Leaf17]